MKKVIEHLQALGEGSIKPMDVTEGICEELKAQFGYHIAYEVVKPLMKDWSMFSGDEMFPVPDPDGVCPKLRFIKTKKNVWLGKYGSYRMALCLYLSGVLSR